MITQARLKELLHYNPDTGVFTRKKNGRTAGGIARNGAGKPYWSMSVDGKTHKAHRLAWLFSFGHLPKNDIDHEDGNGLNNKISNLRDVSHHINCKNRRLQSNNSSGYNGVCWVKKESTWRICWTEGGVRKYRFIKSLLDAVALKIRKNKEQGFHENHGQSRRL